VRRSFTADRSGTLTAKLWGGAGAGGTYFATTAATRKGGAGGYTEVQIPLVAGDVISVEVGQGGQKPWSSLGPVDGANSGLSTTSKPMYPGAGGWPDGGTGGRHGAAPWGGFGGGGGSTRIYKNGVLVGIAAGGGGSTGLFFGGSGGATVGGQSADSSFCGTGGTQSAGGTADGASLKGAPGYVVDPTTDRDHLRRGRRRRLLRRRLQQRTHRRWLRFRRRRLGLHGPEPDCVDHLGRARHRHPLRRHQRRASGGRGGRRLGIHGRQHDGRARRHDRRRRRRGAAQLPANR
jgi:hypothetical protein